MNYEVGLGKGMISERLFLEQVSWRKAASLDTETTGLLPYTRDDRVFAITVGGPEDAYYFDTRAGKLPQCLLELFGRRDFTWYLHNASFDLHSLYASFGQVPVGKIHDTAIGARVEFNDHFGAKPYSLAACGERIGVPKDDAVKAYIDEHKLKTLVPVRGKKAPYEVQHFDRVPHEIMFKYACQDAIVTYNVASKQIQKMIEVGKLLPKTPTPWSVMETECKLSPVIFRMERDGVNLDIPYCELGLAHYQGEQEKLKNEFRTLTGQDYKASPVLFAEVFVADKALWEYTEKGNPSFEGDIIKFFESPAAKIVNQLRDAKSRTDFFASFLFFADRHAVIHPSFNSGGTATLRFSSSKPNFQNLTNDEEAPDEAFPIRRAIIPPNGSTAIIGIDYEQQEYRLLLEYALQMDVIEAVKGGADVHQATANLMGVSRKVAKSINFGLLYGMGAPLLAKSLKISVQEAKELRALYFAKLPRVKKFIDTVMDVAATRGYVHNWAGVRYWCPNKNFAYGMPNRVIQGGGASIMKRAMVSLDELFTRHKAQSRMMLSIHDELDFYVHDSELALVPEIKRIMETTYPSKHLPLTVSVSHSWKSLGDLMEGVPEKLAS